jgi:hypothetical protein
MVKRTVSRCIMVIGHWSLIGSMKLFGVRETECKLQLQDFIHYSKVYLIIWQLFSGFTQFADLWVLWHQGNHGGKSLILQIHELLYLSIAASRKHKFP